MSHRGQLQICSQAPADTLSMSACFSCTSLTLHLPQNAALVSRQKQAEQFAIPCAENLKGVPLLGKAVLARDGRSVKCHVYTVCKGPLSLELKKDCITVHDDIKT